MYYAIQSLHRILAERPIGSSLAYDVLSVLETAGTVQPIHPLHLSRDPTDEQITNLKVQFCGLIDYARGLYAGEGEFVDIPAMHDEDTAYSLVASIAERFPNVHLLDCIIRRYDMDARHESETRPPVIHAIRNTNFALVKYLLLWAIRSGVRSHQCERVREAIDQLAYQRIRYANERAEFAKEEKDANREVDWDFFSYVDAMYPDYNDDDAAKIIEIVKKLWAMDAGLLTSYIDRKFQYSTAGLAHGICIEDPTRAILQFAGDQEEVSHGEVAKYEALFRRMHLKHTGRRRSRKRSPDQAGAPAQGGPPPLVRARVGSQSDDDDDANADT